MALTDCLHCGETSHAPSFPLRFAQVGNQKPLTEVVRNSYYVKYVRKSLITMHRYARYRAIYPSEVCSTTSTEPQEWEK